MTQQIPSFNRDHEPQYDLQGDAPHFGGGKDDFPPIGEQRSRGGARQKLLLGVLAVLLAGGAAAYFMLPDDNAPFVPPAPSIAPTPTIDLSDLNDPAAQAAMPAPTDIDPMTGLPLPPQPPLAADGTVQNIDPLAATVDPLADVPVVAPPSEPNLEIAQVDETGETIIAPVDPLDPAMKVAEDTVLQEVTSDSVASEVTSEQAPAVAATDVMNAINEELQAGTAPAQTTSADSAAPAAAPAKASAKMSKGYYDTEDIISELADLRRNRGIARAPTEGAPGYVTVQRAGDGSAYDNRVIAAQRAMNLSRYESALELYNQAYATNPNDVRVLLGRGIAYQRLGDVNMALHSYEEALRVSPDNKEATINMLGLLRGQDPAFVAQRLMGMQSRHPASAGIAAQLSVIYAEQGDYPSATRYIMTAISLEPQNPMHPYNRAILAERQGQRDQAIDFYEKALEVDAIYGNAGRLPRETIYDRLAVLRARPLQ